MTSAADENTFENKISKFQELNELERYIVIELLSLETQFGRSYIMKLVRSSDNTEILAYSSSNINKYVKDKNVKKYHEKFSFTVSRIEKGPYIGKLYADIHGYNANILIDVIG